MSNACNVLGTVPQDSELEILGIEAGWARINYFGQLGYVLTDLRLGKMKICDIDTLNSELKAWLTRRNDRQKVWIGIFPTVDVGIKLKPAAHLCVAVPKLCNYQNPISLITSYELRVYSGVSCS